MKLASFLLTVMVCSVCGYPSGPPAAEHFSLVCEQLAPSPGAHGPAQSGYGGYLLSVEPAMPASAGGFVYKPSQAYSVELVGTTHSFRGFLIEARNTTMPPPASPHLIGQFTGLGDDAQILDCDPDGVATKATVGHSNANTRSSVQFTWIAPVTMGTVDFVYTVVRERSIHFDQLSAAQLGPPPLEDAPGNTLPPIKSPEDYRLHFHTPNGCERAQCSVYVAIDTNRGNDSYLDIYLEGSAEGWVGVGFSHTENMFSTDAVACNRLDPDMVALDLFNLASPQRTSPTDVIQDVYLFRGDYNNGRLSCKAIKRILPSDQFDIDLNQDLYVLFGKRSSESTVLKIINPHDFDQLPEVTSVKINVVNASNSSGGGNFEEISRKLTKTHGVLMLTAWPLLAVTAIFFPVFMKSVLPGGEWFQVHRALMLASVCVGGAGVILIFVAQLHQSIPGLIPLGTSEPVRTTHFVFGVIVMTLHLINPIIGLIRCSPDSESRWIFNILHGRALGLGALLLALINIALGSWLIDSAVTFWVVLSWEAVFLVSMTALMIIYSFIAASSSSEDRASKAPSTIQALFRSTVVSERLQWSVKEGVTIPSGSERAPLVPGKSAPVSARERMLRWTSLFVFLSFSVPLVLTAIVFVGISN